MTSAAFAIALLVFTVITFLDWSDFRHWPEWVGLLLSIVIAVVAFKRAKDEGVEMPKMPQSASATAAGRRRSAAPPRASDGPPRRRSSSRRHPKPGVTFARLAGEG